MYFTKVTFDNGWGGQHQDLVPDTDLVWKWGLLPAKQVHREVKQGSHISGLVTGDAGL